jgi:hypothetical protein
MLPLNHLFITACLLCLYPVGSYAQPANRFDIIINELLPDPSPVVGLPNSEFIELKNNSSFAFSLLNWKLGDGTTTATINVDFILQPGEYVIICPNAAVAEYSNYGKAIGVPGFPSLNNDGDLITVYSPEGKIIHAVEYSADWYQNDIKREGGWSLEMIDGHNPCSGTSNWKASTDQAGGTPGKRNAVDNINPDDLPPVLLRTYTIDSTTIAVVFNEPVDSNTAAAISNYSIDNGIGQPVSASPVPPLFIETILKLPVALSPNTIYRLTASNLSDCAGNNIGAGNKAAVGMPVAPSTFDIVINEILFNPAPGGYDYIELYNRDKKVIDLQYLYIGNRKATGNFTSLKQLSTRPKLFFPGEYCLLSENTDWVRMNYLVKDQSNFVRLSSLPSMPDDKEHIALIHLQGEMIDQLSYDKSWHFALIDNDEGISLERINYNDSSQNKNNWTSAGSTAGFGTPGYQNSQYRADLSVQGAINLFPKVFSPDNSGLDDFTTISCRVTEPGNVVNITVFDDKGRPVRYLIKNATMGTAASFRWDGMDEQNKKLPVGHYIMLTEIFNLQGKTKKFRNVVVLAAKL